MPPAVDGTVISAKSGQLFEARYGAKGKAAGDHTQGITLIETPMPVVSSNGASFDTLEQYMLSLPGISPELAAELRALGDLRNRMPVPIDVNKQAARQVQVDGATALAIGDNSGVGAAIVWQKSGLIYSIFGTDITMDQLVAMANGLR